MNVGSNRHQSGVLEQIEHWMDVARQLGYRFRYDHFGSGGGGACEFGGQKWLFVDVSLSAWEQLELLETSISQDPRFVESLNVEGKKRPAA